MTTPPNNWADDKLDRQKCAHFLTQYLTKRYGLPSGTGKTESLVLNIRANWGYGKTFFVSAWMKDLAYSNHPVVYFDAWANDFSDDPLVGFISEMNGALTKHFQSMPVIKRHIDEAFAIGKRLIKPVGMGVASVLAKKLANCNLEELRGFFTGTADDANELDTEAETDTKKDEKSVSSVIAKCAEIAVKEHASKKETIGIFRKRLARLIVELGKQSNVQLPMFVFIDELDRCRPNYAIELLEAVKHLFGVPGIYFITSTNLDQLGHSVRAVYGEKFDAEHYLKRFFDQEYLLPDPALADYAEFLFNQYQIAQLANLWVPNTGFTVAHKQPALSMYIEIVRAANLGLRDQEQIVSALQAVLLSWPAGTKAHLTYLLCLLVIKHRNASLFQDIWRGETPTAKEFREIIAKDMNVRALIPIYPPKERNGNPGTIALGELFYQYFQLSRDDFNTMRQAVTRFSGDYNVAHDISQEVLGDEFYNKPGPPWTSSLSRYHSLVGTAGQLS